MDAWWWLVGAVVLLVALLMIFKPDPYLKIVVFVRDGIWITVLLTVISFVFTLVVGMIGGLSRIAKNPVIHFIATVYVECIRGIPLVQLFWWYFCRSAAIKGIVVWLILLPWQSISQCFVLAVVGLVVCYGAYMMKSYGPHTEYSKRAN
jgi:polar amino acid transport system permease protein